MIPPRVAPPELGKLIMSLEMIENMLSPRVIKSHLPFHLLHPKLLDTSKVSLIITFYFKLLFIKRWARIGSNRISYGNVDRIRKIQLIIFFNSVNFNSSRNEPIRKGIYPFGHVLTLFN